METAMRNVARIAAAVVTLAVLSLLAAMPLVAAWRMSADQSTPPASINARELIQHSTDLPGQRLPGLSLVY
jgi:hypothetical protein